MGAHSSCKVVKFFPEDEDDDDDDSNASTASTEEHRSSADLHSESSEELSGDLSAAQCLAGDVVESYWHIRYYLRDIGNSLERVDPNLSNNQELVSRLEDWEEHCKLGMIMCVMPRC